MNHKSVMLDEVIEYLNIQPEARIIDATLNGGGHTEGILERYPSVKVMGIEWDPDIFQEFQSKVDSKGYSERLIIINDSYVNLKQLVEEKEFRPDGIVFDLGLSSWHYDKSGRGFTFQKDEPLDMRFHPEKDAKTASDILNISVPEEIEEIIRLYGEEEFSESITENIIKNRRIKPITKTSELVEIINMSVPGWYKKKKIHPATKTFQALRIAVNGELDNVENGVMAAIDVLNKGGRLVVISFHGLEDKIVKEIFKLKAKEGVIKWVVKGTVKPKWDEIKSNPRARSAKMKICEKL